MSAQEPGSSVAIEFGTATASRQGEFSFANVAAGEYMVVATQVVPRSTASVDGTVGPQDVRWARVPLSVTDTDITGMIVPLRSGLMVKGELTIDGLRSMSSTQFQFAGLPVSAQPTAMSRGALRDQLEGFTATAIVDPDGRFQLGPLLPGAYSFHVPAVGPWRFRGLKLHRNASPLTTFHVLDHEDVELVLSNRFGSVVGRVSQEDRSDARASVFVFPTDGTSHSGGKDAIAFRLVHASASGEFIVEDLPVGSYYAAAVRDERFTSEWHDPGVLAHLMVAATRFSLVDGERRELILRPVR